MSNIKIFSKSGFSLMQAIVVMGLVAIGSVGMMELTKFNTKSTKAIEVRYDVIDSVSQINSILSETNACLNTFSGLNINTPNTFSNPSVIKFSSGNNSRFNTIDTFQSGLKIQSMTLDLNNKTDMGNNWHMIPFMITFSRPASSQSSTNQIKRIDVRVEVNGTNDIVRCVTSGMLQSNFTSDCNSQNNGKTRFNNVSKKLEVCSDNNWGEVGTSPPGTYNLTDCRTVLGSWSTGTSTATCATDEIIHSGGAICSNGSGGAGAPAYCAASVVFHSTIDYPNNRWSSSCQYHAWGPQQGCARSRAVCCKKN